MRRSMFGNRVLVAADNGQPEVGEEGDRAFDIADAATPNVLHEGEPLHAGLFYVSYTGSYDETRPDTVHR